jgi:hypothetical protein
MRSRKLLALLFCLITFPAIAGYMTLLGAGVGNISPTVSWVAGTDTFPDTSLTYSGPSLSTMFDSTGKLTYKPNNLALNTAALGTQSVTVQVGTNYLISFASGGGSIALSGAGAGTVTSASPVKITASTATLTLTVTGTVTNAVVAAVTYETSPRPGDQVITTASAYYGPRIDYDPNTLAVKGLLIEEARTNSLTYSNTQSNAAWVASAGAAKSSPSVAVPDGTTNANLITLVAGTSGHQVYQSFTATAAAWTHSVYAKAGTASWVGFGFVSSATADGAFFNLSNGTIGTVASGTTATINSDGSGWYRITVTRTLSAGASQHTLEVHTADNQAYNFNAAGTETVYFFGSQTEPGSFATSYIPTATASVTRAADVVQFTGAALTALQGSAGTAILQSISLNGSSPAAITNLIRGTNSILYRDTTSKTGTTNGTTALLTAAAPTWNASLRNGLAWSASGRSLAYTGGAVATDANTVSNGGTLYLGSNNGSAVENGWYKSFGIWNQRLGDATLQTKLTVGGSYAANDNGIRYAFANNDNLPIHWRVAL